MGRPRYYVQWRLQDEPGDEGESDEAEEDGIRQLNCPGEQREKIHQRVRLGGVSNLWTREGSSHVPNYNEKRLFDNC